MSRVTVYSDTSQRWHLIEGDALELLAKLPAESIDAVICDPPYGLGFHGERWDGQQIRSVVPLARPEEAFERWCHAWALACARVLKPGGHLVAFGAPRTFHRLVAGLEDAGLEVRDQLLWLYAQGVPKSRRLPGGMGTALKPAYEPILLARAPLIGTTTATLAAHGTSTLNIDAASIGTEHHWPANLAVSHSPDCPVGLIDAPAGGPSRLFFCAKATKAEREAGCEQLPLRDEPLYSRPATRLRRNIHPTVKPIALMRWLIRLAVPEGGLVLDPFTGSGSTGIAAVLEGRRFVGIEREDAYVEVACARLTHWARQATKEPT